MDEIKVIGTGCTDLPPWGDRQSSSPPTPTACSPGGDDLPPSTHYVMSSTCYSPGWSEMLLKGGEGEEGEGKNAQMLEVFFLTNGLCFFLMKYEKRAI